MATNKKNQVTIINGENIKKALKSFEAAYKKNKEKYEERECKFEDVESLAESFSGKSAILATTVILSVLLAMPPREFMVFMETSKSVSKIKLFEAMKEVLKEKANGTDNDIDN